MFLCPGSGGEDNCCSAIRNRGGVAGGNRAIFDEGGAQCRESLYRAIRADSFVLIDGDASPFMLRNFYRSDLIMENSFFPGSRSSPVRQCCSSVLIFPRGAESVISSSVFTPME